MHTNLATRLSRDPAHKSKKVICSIDARNDYQNLFTQISLCRVHTKLKGDKFFARFREIRASIRHLAYSFNYSHRNYDWC